MRRFGFADFLFQHRISHRKPPRGWKLSERLGLKVIRTPLTITMIIMRSFLFDLPKMNMKYMNLCPPWLNKVFTDQHSWGFFQWPTFKLSEDYIICSRQQSLDCSYHAPTWPIELNTLKMIWILNLMFWETDCATERIMTFSQILGIVPEKNPKVRPFKFGGFSKM